MLTSADETDLLLPLLAGDGRGGPFAAFLARLQRRTQAEYAGLLLDEQQFFAGNAPLDLAQAIRVGQLRPGRVYALTELAGGSEITGDARVVRLGGEADAWLVLARNGECSAADAALLSALAPYVSAALGQYLASLRCAARDKTASTALEHAGVGWIVLDAERRVIEVDPAFAARCEAVGLRLRAGERIASLEAENRDGGVVLHHNPRIEAVQVPAMGQGGGWLVLCRIGRQESGAAHRLFAQLTGLPPREAQFAVALAQGGSIAEAGVALGLTKETARNYSKQVYAKLGLNGQAQLVRRFYESGASLA